MRRNALVITALLVALAINAGAAAASPGYEEPYGNESGNVQQEEWTDNRTGVTVENVSHYVSRIGTFVIGGHPNDPGAGALFTGLFVGGMSAMVLGTSRAGLTASGTIGVVTVAGLAAPMGVGFLPRWLYGGVVLLVAFAAGALYLKLVR